MMGNAAINKWKHTNKQHVTYHDLIGNEAMNQSESS